MPVIHKPRSEGGSIGVQVAHDPGQLARTLASDAGRGEWLIEPFTADSAVTCGVLQRDGALVTLPPLETVPTTAEFYDYAAKRDAAGKVNGALALGARVVRYDRHGDDRDAMARTLAA
jgi:D-alanine-D-alanine ligase